MRRHAPGDVRRAMGRGEDDTHGPGASAPDGGPAIRAGHEAERPAAGPEAQEPDGSWQRMLRARPVRNTAAEVKGGGEGGLRITVKKRKPDFLFPPLSWIIRPRLKGAAELDALGAQVWDMCAGERTVEQIVDDFASRHRLTVHESRVAVTNYMKLLVERGALAVAV